MGGSNIIVMAFSPRYIVGCLLKKGLQRGGVTGNAGPPSPSYAHEQGHVQSLDMQLFGLSQIDHRKGKTVEE